MLTKGRDVVFSAASTQISWQLGSRSFDPMDVRLVSWLLELARESSMAFVGSRSSVATGFAKIRLRLDSIKGWLTLISRRQLALISGRLQLSSGAASSLASNVQFRRHCSGWAALLIQVTNSQAVNYHISFFALLITEFGCAL